ncbi:MAG: laminin G domain-containing protein [Planctomycetota bacterium]
MAGAVALLATCSLTATASEASFIWQEDQAKVLPNGDLEWQPQAYQYQPGNVVRYIDHAGGSDQNDGSKGKPWQHHPWDRDARGQAKAFDDAATFVFKGGVTYRGQLRVDSASGTAEQPIQFTRDPDWGDGPAVLAGSEPVSGWQRGGHADMPDSGKVWHADLEYAPRCVWMVAADGSITRLNLARTPNWQESDPYDVTSEWWTWENPQWWKNGLKGHTCKVGGKEYHLGIDRKNLTRDGNDYQGAYAWTEWGIVMGSPFPSKITYYDPKQRGVNVGGPWNDNLNQAIIRNNRYYLEDKAWMLDEAGEFWFERKSRQGDGRLYLRLPKDTDPNTVTIEAARHNSIISADELHHCRISGLTFRFTNMMWELSNEKWRDESNTHGAIHLVGKDMRGDAAFTASFSGGDIDIHNNHFEHVNYGVVIDGGETGQITSLRIADNVITDTDLSAIAVGVNGNSVDINRLDLVEVLRDELERIGWRNIRGLHGHALTVSYPERSVIAGNVLNRTAGWGIGWWGGKSSNAEGEAPLSRQIIYHNRVEDPLLKSNDWGGIESWQGGMHYVYNNVSINPGGYKNWGHKPDSKEGTPRFGFAYYLDGSFKNYLFNNIAIGRNNEPGSKYANTSGLQGIIGFQNEFLHNTFYQFVVGSRQQSPDAGRYKYLANIFQDISELLFRHADEKKKKDANAADFKQGDRFGYEHLAYVDNILHEISDQVAVFEPTGQEYSTVDSFAAALQDKQALQAEVGLVTSQDPLRNPDEGDFRPTDAAQGHALKVFAPWSLYAPVGEWHFHRNQQDPSQVHDDHWFMTRYYANRSNYRETPRYPLQGNGISADQYQQGTLETWTDSALSLQADQALRVSHGDLVAPYTADFGRKAGTKTFEDDDKRTVDMQDNNFLIEAVVRSQGGSGVIAGKMAATGYALELDNGSVIFRLSDGSKELTVRGPKLPTGSWSHVLAEADRQGEATLYLDGKAVGSSSGSMPTGSLSNSDDFVVGAGLAMDYAFLRVCRGTLANAATSIEELRAWQFDGPIHHDFAGNPREPGQSAAGALAR